MQREGQVRIPAGCAISSIFSRSGKRIDGSKIVKSIEIMRRSSYILYIDINA